MNAGKFDGRLQASYVLHVCVPPPDETRGLRLLSIDFDVPSFRNPLKPFWYEWKAITTSYGAEDTPKPSSRLELHTEVAIPNKIELTTSYDARRRVLTASGSVSGGGAPRPYVALSLWISPTWPFNETKATYVRVVTDGRGRFHIARPLNHAAWIYAVANVYGSNACTSAGVIPCAFQSISPPPDAVTGAGVPPLKPNA